MLHTRQAKKRTRYLHKIKLFLVLRTQVNFAPSKNYSGQAQDTSFRCQKKKIWDIAIFVFKKSFDALIIKGELDFYDFREWCRS